MEEKQMELDDLLKLIDHVSKSKLDDFCYETGNMKLRLKKNAAKEVVVKNPEELLLQNENRMQAASGSFLEESASYETEEASETQTINSPLVGIFYTAPGEGEAPFVSVGDTVKKGQTLGIVEAMKLMHEITAEESGVVEEICVANGEAVEFGQRLFIIK